MPPSLIADRRRRYPSSPLCASLMISALRAYDQAWRGPRLRISLSLLLGLSAPVWRLLRQAVSGEPLHHRVQNAVAQGRQGVRNGWTQPPAVSNRPMKRRENVEHSARRRKQLLSEVTMKKVNTVKKTTQNTKVKQRSRVVVFGSRCVPETDATRGWVLKQLKAIGPIMCLIDGGQRGGEAVGRQVATRSRLPVVEMRADWDRAGKQALFTRNRKIALIADIGVCLWDGKSGGTFHLIKEMKKFGKPVIVFNSLTKETTRV